MYGMQMTMSVLNRILNLVVKSDMKVWDEPEGCYGPRYDASEVTVTDEIPDSLKVLDVRTANPDWDCTITGVDSEGFGGTIVCALPVLDRYEVESIEVDVEVRVGTVGEIENTAVVSAKEKETNDENNSSTETTPSKNL